MDETATQWHSSEIGGRSTPGRTAVDVAVAVTDQRQQAEDRPGSGRKEKGTARSTGRHEIKVGAAGQSGEARRARRDETRRARTRQGVVPEAAVIWMDRAPYKITRLWRQGNDGIGRMGKGDSLHWNLASQGLQPIRRQPGLACAGRQVRHARLQVPYSRARLGTHQALPFGA